MGVPKAPAGLEARGRRLWRELHQAADLDPAQRVLAEEACRIADRLEKLDGLLRGDAEDWVRIRTPPGFGGDDGEMVLVIDGALSEARQQANVLKQLLVTLRLPDAKTGARPQRRSARGAYQTGSAKAAGGGTVSSLERARRAAGG